jgi:hypothetical protein
VLWIEGGVAPGADLTTPASLILANHIGYIEIWALQATTTESRSHPESSECRLLSARPNNI